MTDKLYKTAVILLLAAMIVSGYELWKAESLYSNAAKLDSALSRYGPDKPPASSVPSAHGGETGAAHDPTGAKGAILAQAAHIAQEREEFNTSRPDYKTPIINGDSQIETQINAEIPFETNGMIVNGFVADMQTEVSGDIIGWITLSGANVDYPVVAYRDNDYYLRRNVYGQQSAAGSIFMDCRCGRRAFECFNTIIYGHNMKNGSMFGGLKRYAEPGFAENNREGAFYAEDNTYAFEIFACMQVAADDGSIYERNAEPEAFFAYVKENALFYFEPVNKNRVVTLSTCASGREGVRLVLIATISTAQGMMIN